MVVSRSERALHIIVLFLPCLSVLALIHNRKNQAVTWTPSASSPEGTSTRRTFVSASILFGDWIASSRTSRGRADDDFLLSQPESAKLEAGLLKSRVQSNVLNPPPYGMEGTDIFYPSWFAGNWKVRSQTKEVQAPCGEALFGGYSTLQNAINDVGNVLRYDSRFLTDGSGRVIADREYNVKSIARVSMGENSVVDVSTATPNKFSCLIVPQGAPSMIAVDLLVLNRRQENVGNYNFDCSEVVREIVTPVDRPKQQQPILKEIETTSLYTYVPDKDEVRCLQRSAAFLLPSVQNDMATKLWQMSQGRAIDVRFYDVVYTRV